MVVTPADGASPELRDVSQRRPHWEELKRIWARRHFLWYAAVSELRAQEMDTFLGNLWHLFNPALQIFVYFIVFGQILGTDRGVDNFIPFLAIGIFSFGFIRSIAMSGAKSLVSNSGLIKTISFPLTTLPISVAVSELVAFGFPLAVMLGVAVLTGEFPALTWLAIAPIIGLQWLFAVGLGFMAARITFHVRDFQNILGFLFRMAFYFSGVLFLVDRFVPNPTARHIVNFNPFFDYLSLQRWAVMGDPVPGAVVAAAFMWAIVTPVLGFVWFRRKEGEYGRE
jgi:teichoic acid transport system permease protein